MGAWIEITAGTPSANYITGRSFHGERKYFSDEKSVSAGFGGKNFPVIFIEYRLLRLSPGKNFPGAFFRPASKANTGFSPDKARKAARAFLFSIYLF